MSDFRLDLLKGEHTRLAAEASLVFRVVDLGIACRDDQDHAVVRAERQRFGNTRRFAADCLRSQLHRRRRYGKFHDAAVRIIFFQPCTGFFNRH